MSLLPCYIAAVYCSSCVRFEMASSYDCYCLFISTADFSLSMCGSAVKQTKIDGI